MKTPWFILLGLAIPCIAGDVGDVGDRYRNAFGPLYSADARDGAPGRASRYGSAAAPEVRAASRCALGERP